MTDKQNAFVVGIHKDTYRCGQPAMITGVCIVKPNGLEPRLCYEIKFVDDYIDEIPVSNIADGIHKIVTLREIQTNNF